MSIETGVKLTDKEVQVIIGALDELALALGDHQWTNKERRLYERAIRLLTSLG